MRKPSCQSRKSNFFTLKHIFKMQKMSILSMLDACKRLTHIATNVCKI